MTDIRIQPVDHRLHQMARWIHAVQMAGYAREASLIGVKRFEPLDRSVADIQHSDAQFIGAIAGKKLVGAVSIEREPDAPPDTVHITSLVVAPTHLRRGIGRRLLEATIAAHGERPITVSTAVRNLPALTLYTKFNFVAGERSIVGREAIEVVRLRRMPSQP